jgi:hypothetical protein
MTHHELQLKPYGSRRRVGRRRNYTKMIAIGFAVMGMLLLALHGISRFVWVQIRCSESIKIVHKGGPVDYVWRAHSPKSHRLWIIPVIVVEECPASRHVSLQFFIENLPPNPRPATITYEVVLSNSAGANTGAFGKQSVTAYWKDGVGYEIDVPLSDLESASVIQILGSIEIAVESQPVRSEYSLEWSYNRNTSWFVGVP